MLLFALTMGRVHLSCLWIRLFVLTSSTRSAVYETSSFQYGETWLECGCQQSPRTWWCLSYCEYWRFNALNISEYSLFLHLTKGYYVPILLFSVEINIWYFRCVIACFNFEWSTINIFCFSACGSYVNQFFNYLT